MDMRKNYGISDFNYLSSEYLEDLELKSGSLISINTECGKIINNFNCYIACSISTEKALSAKVGDNVKLRILTGDEINATINHIIDEKNNRIIIFKIDKDVEKLVEYRKLDLDIIWWNYSGLKVSNSAIKEENDISYLEQNKTGYANKIYIKVLRQNEAYSIIQNYTDDELRALGIDEEYIKKRNQINVYDEILLH